MGSVVRVVVIVVVVVGIVGLVRPNVVGRVFSDGSSHKAAPSCRIPINYHLGTIERGFGLDRSQVRDALDDAIGMWQAASETTLFLQDSGEGLAIELRSTDRQEQARERLAAEDRLGSEKEALDEREDELASERSEFREDWEAFVARRKEHEERVNSHQERLEDWQAGRVEQTRERRRELNETAEELEAEAQALEKRHEALSQRRQRLQQRQNELKADIDQYNERVEAHNSGASEERGFRMGEYRQVGDERRISIYKAVDPDELRLVLAHELGHALGIGHVAASDAVMHEDLGRANRGRESVSSADRRALTDSCDVRL